MSKPLLGTMIWIPHPSVSEIASLAGYDWVMIDMEHSTMGFGDVERLMQALQNNCLSIVRIPGKEEFWIRRILDLGCDGIMVPMVNTAEQAEYIIKTAKYPPEGSRGIGSARAHHYGFRFKDYLKTANDRIRIILQIEHIEAVQNLSEILKVDGYDALLIGPNDLAASMGYIGQTDHPQVLETVQFIVDECRKANVKYGIFGSSPDSLLSHMNQEHCKYVVCGVDMVLYANGIQNLLDSLKANKV